MAEFKFTSMRDKIPDNFINELPKPTKAQTDEVKSDYKKGVRCNICGTWHHPKVVHLSYFGHAALTSMLLDVDPEWNWEPLALDDKGFPAIDANGGLWIKLTVCGVTRLGYGDAQGKTGGDAMKERIGDALRNAAMRFGAALDLWHKGDLHVDDQPQETDYKKLLQKCKNLIELQNTWTDIPVNLKQDLESVKNKRKADLTPKIDQHASRPDVDKFQDDDDFF